MKNDRQRLISFLKKRLSELEKKIADLVANNVGNHEVNIGWLTYQKLIEKIPAVIFILENTQATGLDRLQWLGIDALSLLADDIDESATFRNEGDINGWLMEFGHKFDPFVFYLPANFTDTLILHHWMPPDYSDPSRQGSRLIQWNELERVLEILKCTFSRKFETEHFFMCHHDFNQDDDVAGISRKLKKSFVRQFIDVCAKYEIHRYGERVESTTNPFDETDFVAIQKKYVQIFLSDFEHNMLAPPATLHDIPLSLTALNRGFGRDVRDVNTCWFNSSLRILSTIKEVFSKFVFELVWEKDKLCESNISFNSLLKGDTDVLAFMDVVFERQRNEDSMVIYENLFQVLMSTFFTAQHQRCNINGTVYTTGLRSVFSKLLLLNKEYRNAYDLSDLDIPSDGDFVPMANHLQSIITFLGHDLKKLFILERRQTMICQGCELMIYTGLPVEYVVCDMVWPPDAPNNKTSLSKWISKNSSKFETACDTLCPCCNEGTMQGLIIRSISKYFLVHPFRGNTRAVSQPSFTLENKLFLPIYPLESEGAYNIEYRLKAFVHFKDKHFTTYFSIEGNDNFWILHDDNCLPELKRRNLNDAYPVELAMYEKVVAGEHVEPRKLLPHEERVLAQTLEEIHSQMQYLEEEIEIQQTMKKKTLMKEMQMKMRELEDYKQLLERNGDLAPLVLRIVNAEQLQKLNCIVIDVDEPDSFIAAHLQDRDSLTKKVMDVEDLNTPVKEDARSEVCQPDMTALAIANDLPIEKIEDNVSQLVSSAETAQALVIDLPAEESKINGENWLACEEKGCQTNYKMAKILSCGHTSYCRDCLLTKIRGRMSAEPRRCPNPTCTVIIDGLRIFENPIRHCAISSTRETVLDAALCDRITSRNSNFYIDYIDAPMPTSREDCNNKRWRFKAHEVFSIDHCYICSLPSFIWRSLNALKCTVYPADKDVVGTAPRNICGLVGLRDSKIQVDLITNKHWHRFGNKPDSVRFAFAFTYTTQHNRTFDIAVWENYNDPSEWEIGFLHSYTNFFSATDSIMANVQKNRSHPFYNLLRRAVQVMTGKQNSN